MFASASNFQTSRPSDRAAYDRPPMRQLTSLDAQFLALESARQTGHVGGLAVLDPSTTPAGTLYATDILKLLEERLPALPPFRWKLAEVPFGLDFPYWIEDPDFDLH